MLIPVHIAKSTFVQLEERAETEEQRTSDAAGVTAQL